MRRCFAPAERRRLADCASTLRSPSRLAGVVKEKTRSRLGLYQLDRRFPELAHSGLLERSLRALVALAAAPRTWPGLPVYALVAGLTRFRAWRRARRGDFRGWDRDRSSRPAGEALGLRGPGPTQRIRKDSALAP